jgi:hypothetical protein
MLRSEIALCPGVKLLKALHIITPRHFCNKMFLKQVVAQPRWLQYMKLHFLFFGQDWHILQLSDVQRKCHRNIELNQHAFIHCKPEPSSQATLWMNTRADCVAVFLGVVAGGGAVGWSRCVAPDLCLAASWLHDLIYTLTAASSLVKVLKKHNVLLKVCIQLNIQ